MRRQARRGTTMMAALAAAALAAAGCSSGTSSSSAAANPGTSAPAASAPGTGGAGRASVTSYLAYTGGKSGRANPALPPVYIGWINQQGGQQAIGPLATAGAQMAVKYINAELGGVGGHPVALKTCFIASAEEEGTTCQLSSGQRKLVGVARALAAGPRLLCLDEPAAGLDTAESGELGECLRSLAGQGQSMLLIEHDMGLVLSICDRVVVLESGRVIADGTPQAVRRDARVIAAYLGTGASQAPAAESRAMEPADDGGE